MLARLNLWLVKLTETRVSRFRLIYVVALVIFCLLTRVAYADEFDDDFAAFEEQMAESKTEIYDPLEPLNRKIFAFNDFADEYVVGYVIDGYRYIFPRTVRDGIGNFFTNLSKPFSFINSLAQGKVDNALASLSSFIINTTIGIFGIVDVAGEEEVYYNHENFGQTLGYYGVGPGPYLVLPFIGPSTTREFSSFLAENAVSPAGFDIFSIDDKINVDINTERSLALAIMDGIDKRERLSEILEEAKKDSFDYYATIRSYYLQNIESKVKE